MLNFNLKVLMTWVLLCGFLLHRGVEVNYIKNPQISYNIGLSLISFLLAIHIITI